MVLEGLNEFVTDKQNEPEPYEWVWYLFFSHGISYSEFQKLPMPYIMSIVRTHKRKSELEEAEMKKARRK